MSRSRNNHSSDFQRRNDNAKMDRLCERQALLDLEQDLDDAPAMAQLVKFRRVEVIESTSRGVLRRDFLIVVPTIEEDETPIATFHSSDRRRRNRSYYKNLRKNVRRHRESRNWWLNRYIPLFPSRESDAA